MKKTILSFTLILLAITSCSKKESKITNDPSSDKDSLKMAKKFRVDSIIAVDSVKINNKLTLSYEQSVLVFDDIKSQSVLDSIYAPTYLKVNDFSKVGLQKALTTDMKKYFEEEKTDFVPDYPQKWDQTSAMKIHSNDNNLLTLVYQFSGYTGGAHGYYNEIYKVFDLKNNKSILLNDIVKNANDKIWNKILMDNFNQQNADANDMLLEKVIPLNANFYLDQNSITFVYNQYEITAYAAGVIYIKLNLDDIKNHLKPDFLQRIKS